MSTNQSEQGGGSSPTDRKSQGADIAEDIRMPPVVGELKDEIQALRTKELRLHQLMGAADFHLILLNMQFGEISQQEQDELPTQPELSTEPPVELTEDSFKKIVEERNPSKVKRFIQNIVEQIQILQKAIKDKELQWWLAVQQAARENSGLVPSSSKSPMLDFEVTVEQGHITQIQYKKEQPVVWKWTDEPQYIDEEQQETLQDQANKLLTDDEKIDLDKLSQVILECLPPNEREGRRNSIIEATLCYAACANQRSLDSLVGDSAGSEMFLQQAIYPPISLLLHLFAYGLRNSAYYAAGQDILCAHLLKNKNTNKPNCFKGRPDAAIRLSDSFYAVASMEVTAMNVIDSDDLAKCVLLTSMSLVAYYEWFRELDERQANSNIVSMKLPFVVGSMDHAELYVTSLYKSNNQLTPKVEKVCYAKISIQEERIQFVTRLAVLLKCAMTVVLANAPDWCWTLPSDISNIISGQERSSKGSETSTGSESGSTSASYAETSAKEALISLGHLTNVMYPWHRVRWLAFSAEEERQAEFEFYRQQSPFYFVGHFAPDGQKEREAVFCKVWKDGDRKTNRQEIIEEIEHLRLANRLGVPSPKVVEEVTRRDLKLSTTPSLDSSIYHVLTMTKAKNDDITSCDVLDYAVSLIHTVQILHKKAGILHCDIKPSNVSWNADEHKVLLLDFGHAQRELNAKSYLGTKGYEAPEVLDDKPHTRASDAYSVGITLQKVVESVDRSTSNHSCSNVAGVEMQIQLVADVAQGLTHDSPDQRLTLDQAEMSLMSNSFKCSSDGESPPRKKGRYCSEASPDA